MSKMLEDIVPAIGSVVGTVLGGPAGLGMGGLLGKSVRKKLTSTQQTPALPAPTVMPTPDDEAVAAARRRKVAQMQQRGGRSSTILSSEERLGG